MLVVAFLASLVADTAWSQKPIYADLGISNITVSVGKGRQLICKIDIHNKGYSPAEETKVQVLLPVGVRFVSSSTCAASPPLFDGTHSFASCNISGVPVNETKSVGVATTLPPTEVSKTFGVFVWSNTPDSIPGNNYGEGTAY